MNYFEYVGFKKRRIFRIMFFLGKNLRLNPIGFWDNESKNHLDKYVFHNIFF